MQLLLTRSRAFVPLGRSCSPAGDNVCMISQQLHLFRGTVRSNIDPTNELNDHDVWEALKRVHFSDYVLDHPLQLDAPIGARGANLSAGQAQLLVRHYRLDDRLCKRDSLQSTLTVQCPF